MTALSGIRSRSFPQPVTYCPERRGVVISALPIHSRSDDRCGSTPVTSHSVQSGLVTDCPLKLEFAGDSPLDEEGFELVVPPSRGTSQRLLRSVSDRSALFCSCRLRDVEFSIPLFDAAGPLMPGNGGADVVRASALARSGNLGLRLAVCEGKNLIIKARRAPLAAS